MRYNAETKEVTMSVTEAIAFGTALAGLRQVGGTMAVRPVGAALIGVTSLDPKDPDEFLHRCDVAIDDLAASLLAVTEETLLSATKECESATDDLCRCWGVQE